jgi:hypothetical protein
MGRALGLSVLGVPLGLGGSAAAAFDPLDLSPALWLKADAGLYQTSGGSAATADGDPVGEWQDQSGNGRHFSQSTEANRPTLKLNIQNGLPVVRLDGSNDSLISSAFQTFPSKRGTLYAVYKNTDSAYGVILATFPAAVTDWEWLGAKAASKYKWYDGAASHLAAVFDLAGWMLHGVIRDGDTSLTSYVNGALADTFTITNNQPSSGAVSLGAATDGTETLAGDLGEILIFDTALSAQEQADLEGYLNTRWGVF